MRNFNANIRLIHKTGKCNSKNEGNQHKNPMKMPFSLRKPGHKPIFPAAYKA